MDRIHRLGQHRPVQAFKLVIEDSIESRIIQVSSLLPPRLRRTEDRFNPAPGEEGRDGRRHPLIG